MRATAPLLAALLLTVGLQACGGGDPGGPEVPSEGGRPTHLDVPDPQAGTGGENDPRWEDAPYVVLVSLDGFAARYMGQYAPPTLAALSTQGVWAPEGMIPVYPSKTFPNHYSLATGMYADRTGIVANTFYDPGRGDAYSMGDPSTVQDGSWYGGEPLWVTAERQGMVAASFYWVGSEADVGGVRPSYWRAYDASVPNDARVDQVLAWLDYPAAYRPHLITLYFSTTDAVGHLFGPDSPEMAAAVAAVDASVGRLLSGVSRLPHANQVSVIVLSDHGMDGYAVESNRYLADVTDLGGVTMVGAGPSANVFVAGGLEQATSVRDAVNAGLPDVTAYLAHEVPEHFHYRGNPRIGDLVLMPDSGHVVFPADDRPSSAGFTHGWDNRLLSMRALFVAAGPALPSGLEIDPFEAVHVYPLVTRLLGLTPAGGIDGDPAVWDGIVGG